MKDPICQGCECKASETGEYNKNNPVEEDGTYKNGKFVCTACYVKLIDLGLDIGEPMIIQRRARDLVLKVKPTI